MILPDRPPQWRPRPTGGTPAQPGSTGPQPVPPHPPGPQPVPRPAGSPPASQRPSGTPATPPRTRLSVIRGTPSISMLTPVLQRLAVHRTNRMMFLRSIGIASVLVCVLFLVFLVMAPFTDRAMVQVELPREMQKVLIQPEPEPPTPARTTEEAQLLAAERIAVHEDLAPPVEAPPEAIPEPEPPGRRHRTELPEDAGRAGRERAKQVQSKLAGTTSLLDKTLSGLSSALQTPGGTGTPMPRRRSRDLRGGRSEGEMAAVDAGTAGSGAGTDLDRSQVRGAQIGIGSLAPTALAEGSTTEGGTTAGAAPGVYRTNASLLAVIQKYAAGIQYCYENELKHDAGLRGKLVVSLTVASSGRVQDVSIIDDTVGSARLRACALSQIRDWKFPIIATGVTTFQAPFVFTPPN